MTVWVLSDKEQTEIASIYPMGFHTMQQLADKYQVSSATISKVLREKGITGKEPAITVEEANLLQVASKHHLNAVKLETLINEPSLTYPNVIRYLQTLDQDRLLTLFSHTSIGGFLKAMITKEDSHA